MKHAPFIALILGIWLATAIAAMVLKSCDPFDYAFLITVIIGVGYFIATDRSD